MSDVDNWFEEMTNPDNWPTEVKLSAWATMEGYLETAKLLEQIEERGLKELFEEVLAQLGYQVTETPSGEKEIDLSLSRKEQVYSVQRIARFLLEDKNTGKSSQLLSSELRELDVTA